MPSRKLANDAPSMRTSRIGELSFRQTLAESH